MANKSIRLYLKESELIPGEYYICSGRNFYIARWNGTSFEGLRSKFNQTFMDEECHWDDGPPHGTVKPLLRISHERVLESLILNMSEEASNLVFKTIQNGN